jgi:hypothetical protein
VSIFQLQNDLSGKHGNVRPKRLLQRATFAIVFLFSIGVLSAPPQWNLNDVAYLFPLPSPQDKHNTSLLGPKDSGLEGALIPYDAFEVLPFLFLSGPTNERLYDSLLRVVSLRLDPCPASRNDVCIPEIRLVWQPVEFASDLSRWVARDVALHSFYPLSPQQFSEVQNALWNLKVANEAKGISTTMKPLWQHPALLGDQSHSDFSKKLSALVKRYCGAGNMNKLTFMSEFVPAMWWRFGGVEKKKNGSGKWLPFRVPRLDDPFEDVFNIATEVGADTESGRAVDTRITHLPKDYPPQDNLAIVLDRDYRTGDDRDLPNFISKLDAIARFRNPQLSNPLSHDCATCHYADPAKTYMERRFSQLKNFPSLDEYENPNPQLYNFTNLSSTHHSSRNLRAFGYHNSDPAVSQRVIHDAAESAEMLNTLRRSSF